MGECYLKDGPALFLLAWKPIKNQTLTPSAAAVPQGDLHERFWVPTAAEEAECLEDWQTLWGRVRCLPRTLQVVARCARSSVTGTSTSTLRHECLIRSKEWSVRAVTHDCGSNGGSASSEPVIFLMSLYCGDARRLPSMIKPARTGQQCATTARARDTAQPLGKFGT